MTIGAIASLGERSLDVSQAKPVEAEKVGEHALRGL
jgi:hypothetical protein